MKIYIPLRDFVKGVCTSIMSDADEADDLTQDIYVKLWENRAQLDAVESPKAYLATLARNRCFDRLKSSAHRLRNSEEPTELDLPQSADPHRLLVGRERLDALRAWVDQLPEQQRNIFELRHFQMMSNSEVAEALDLKEVTVRSIVSRLRKEMRLQFAND